MSGEYKQVTYATGWAAKVTPENRAADVLHYLTTGYLLGGRSLDGVTWQQDEEHQAIHNRRANALRNSFMKIKS